jgi:hypothetical protein
MKWRSSIRSVLPRCLTVDTTIIIPRQTQQALDLRKDLHQDLRRDLRRDRWWDIMALINIPPIRTLTAHLHHRHIMDIMEMLMPI